MAISLSPPHHHFKSMKCHWHANPLIAHRYGNLDQRGRRSDFIEINSMIQCASDSSSIATKIDE